MANEERMYNMNWSAVAARFQELDEAQTAIAAQIVAFENRLTAAISQFHALTQEVQTIKAGKVGTGPSARH